jgi:hypothetical protein
MAVRTHFATDEILYRGPELSSHFAYKRFDIAGDSCVAFLGGCWVQPHDLVDLADRKANAIIFSKRMLHFILERFDLDLEKAVLRQRLFTAIVQQELQIRGVREVIRRGDDLYVGDAKLSVSIATLSGVSSLVHFGINVISEGTPVKTLGLDDLKIDPRSFAIAVLEQVEEEEEGIVEARCKARAVP